MTPAPAIAAPAGEVRTRHMGGGHLLPLDGLRGVAILAVMASHLFAVDYEHQAAPIRLIGQTLYWGLWGVDLFFVLSGFLITGILVDSRSDSGYFRKFYMRRILRIFPLYYGVLFLLFLLTPVLHIQWHGLRVPLLLYLQNLLRYEPFTQQLGGGISLNHLWSLAVEEQFYLLWPLLVFAARTRPRVLQTALFGCLCAIAFRAVFWGVWHNGYTTHFSVFARADSLLLGGALAMAYRGAAWPTVQRYCRPAFVLLAALLAGSIVQGAREPFHSPWWVFVVRPLVVALASGALLVWALRAGAVSRLFRTRALRFFGKYSYGLYVLHMTFLPMAALTIRGALLRMTHSKGLAVVGNAVVMVALSSLAAWLSFHLYEKHFLRLKRFFDYDRQARPVS